MTKLVYFAWVRERIGKQEEDVSLPADVVTVEDLMAVDGISESVARLVYNHFHEN